MPEMPDSDQSPAAPSCLAVVPTCEASRRRIPATGAGHGRYRAAMTSRSAGGSTGTVPTIDGPRTLPDGFAHAHASQEARRIAEAGMILRVQVGSGVHGTAIGGRDDRDEMGICLEPPAFVTGVARVPRGTGAAGADAEDAGGDGTDPGTVPFEQYERHTAWDRPGGIANRSGAGDLDVIVYSARKWARLALRGNPTVLLVLFAPDAETVLRTEPGAELVANAHRFVSSQAAERFLGYLRAQRRAMTGESSAHTNRPELVARHGYDTKFAMHALRLGVQGVELLTTGRITLPVPQPDLDRLRAIRRGEVPLAEVVAAIDAADRRLVDLRDSPHVPENPDRAWVDDWLHRSHLAYWRALDEGRAAAGTVEGSEGAADRHDDRRSRV